MSARPPKDRLLLLASTCLRHVSQHVNDIMSKRVATGVDTSQDAKVDLKPLIVAIIPIYCLSEIINVLFLFVFKYF